MADIFFYGSLRDRDLVEIVLGRIVPAEALIDARAPGYRTLRMTGEAYPALLPQEGSTAEGVLLIAPTDGDIARLTYFEEAEYGLSSIAVETDAGVRDARYFRVTAKRPPGDALWDFEKWWEEDRAVAHHAARELMAHYGRVPEARIDDIWPGIMIRARQRARAAAEATPPGALGTAFGREDVRLERHDRPYTGFFAVEEYTLRHRRFDGGWSNPLERCAVVWGDAVTVLPYDPRRDRVLLIEQFRPGPLARGDSRPLCIEVVAGRIDADEAADDVARREAVEEAGVILSRLERIGGYYPTGGLAAEHLTSFVGEADLPVLGQSLHGLAEENEDIRAMVLPFDEAMSAALVGDINTAPALLSVLWLAANRDRLRAAWAA